MIGDNITITVLSVRNGHVRLGIDAPKEISVHREEIYHKIKSEQPNDNKEGEDRVIQS